MSKFQSLKHFVISTAAFTALGLGGLALAQPAPAPAEAPAAQAPAPAADAAAPAAPTADAAAAPAEPRRERAPAPAPTVVSGHLPPKDVKFSFEGPMGTYDRAALQRGFQVYKEVCSACHPVKHLTFRNLSQPGGPGFSEAEVKALAATYKVPAGPNENGQTVGDDGQPLMRAAISSDPIPGPFANDQAARAANNGSLPPDLSLVVKAREGGPQYVYSILTGFGMDQGKEVMTRGMNFNPYFEGHQIAMAQPLIDDSVTYADGTKATIDQEAHDVVTFLTWAAEPKMEERKHLGAGVMLFLFGFAALLYLAYRKMWAGQH